MKITPSAHNESILAISGHAGVGHAHSHLGFVQDDSAGFAVAVEILKQAYPVETSIEQVHTDTATGVITVHTRGGGKGTATPRRGLTPHEADLTARAIGLDAAYSQSAAFKVFGRLYGQGVMETPVAFQAACCLAVMDTFAKTHPDAMIHGREDMPGKCGGCIGAGVNIDGVPVSVMALVNASEGGIGPDEDLEGNIMLGDKGRVMKELGLDRLPTIVLESKAYVPSVCEGIDHDRLWIRINGEVDNTYVYQALLTGVEKAQLPYVASDKAYPRNTNEMVDATAAMGKKIADIGERFATLKTSAQKVALMSELALIVSQDAGGVTFMGSEMHNLVAGGGIMPGTAAVLSMTVSEPYIRNWKIPAFDSEDARKYLAVISYAVPELSQNIEAAQLQLQKRFNFDETRFDHLIVRTDAK